MARGYYIGGRAAGAVAGAAATAATQNVLCHQMHIHQMDSDYDMGRAMVLLPLVLVSLGVAAD